MYITGELNQAVPKSSETDMVFNHLIHFNSLTYG